MIHLFKKVYLALDSAIDTFYDRAVVSEENGVDIFTYSRGTLLHASKNVEDIVGPGKNFERYEDFFDLLFERTSTTNDRVMIYADETAFIKIASAWFSLILPHATIEDIKTLVKSFVFRHNAFYKAKWSSTTSRYDKVYDIDFSEYAHLITEKTVCYNRSFVEKVTPHVGVEFILATYLHNGGLKDELKNILKTLIRKDMEKYLLEAKEIFVAHFMTPPFVAHLGLDQVYTIENAEDIVNDQSKYARLFLDSRLWSYPFMSYASSANGNVKLENITEQDIEDLKFFIQYATQHWTHEIIQDNPYSDTNKLSFLGIFHEFTDELLTHIINVESSCNHVSGTFFSIDLVTVNSYLVNNILSHKDEPSHIEKYSLI